MGNSTSGSGRSYPSNKYRSGLELHRDAVRVSGIYKVKKKLCKRSRDRRSEVAAVQVAKDPLASYVWTLEAGIACVDGLSAFEQEDGRART